jgi:gliding motility-associated-like protein
MAPVWQYDGKQYESGDTIKLCRDKGAPDEIKDLNIGGGDDFSWDWAPKPGLKNLTGTINQILLTNTPMRYAAKPTEALGGCSDSLILTIIPYINPDPPTVTSPITYCRYGSAKPLVAIGAAGAPIKYYTTATGGTAYSSYIPNTNAPGTFTYYATQTNGICESGRTPITVIVNPIPNLDSFTLQHPSKCDALDGWIMFKADLKNETYTVYIDKDGFGTPPLTLTSDSKGFIKIPGLGVGSYSAIYIVNKFGCVSNTYYGPIVLKGPMVLDPIVSNNGPICEGEIAKLFTMDVAGTTYLWKGPGGFTSTNSNPTFIASMALDGIYTLVTKKDNCISNPVPTTLVIYPSPKNPKLGDQAICEGNTLDLYVFPEVNTVYTWTGGLDGFVGATSSLTRKNIQLSGSGRYTLYATNEHGCKMYDTLNVEVDPRVQLSHSADTSICFKDSIMLWANTNTNTVLWSPDSGINDKTSKTPRISPNATITYTITAISDHGACPDTSGQVKVSVIPTPKVVGYDTLVRMNIPYTLLPNFGQNVIKWKWIPSDSLSCSDCPNPVFNSSKMMTYVVYGSDEKGCTGSDKVTVRVFCDGANVTMPNAFTPNGDGNNDIFYVRGQGFSVKSFSIYNRLGQEVFTRSNFSPNDAQYGWDGTFGGQAISDAAGFVYVIEVICLNSGNEPMLIKGTVLMIK